MSLINIKNSVGQMLGERSETQLPIWVRPPKPGTVEHYTGLGKGKLYQLEKLGLVKTASLKPRGAVRGVKLFHLQSLFDYVETCAQQVPINKDSEGVTKISTPRPPASPHVEQTTK